MINSRLFIACEFFLLCIALPTFIWVFNFGSAMFGFLWGATMYCALILYISNRSSTGQTALNALRRLTHHFINEWNYRDVTWVNLRPILVRWICATILICGFTYLYEPDRLFFIPREAPHIIPFLVIAYPLLSALPQEYIFCSFFMKRYGVFIPSFWGKIILSALVFGYAHMLFINWVAPVFSFFGGLVFAYTYLKTKSLALVTIEHSLYGNSIFLAGIGYYFYSGGIAQ